VSSLPLPLAQLPIPPASGFELGPLDVRFYGLVIAIGAFLGLQLTVKRYERFGGDPDVAEKAGLLVLVGGFLGARIGYIIPRFLNDGPHGAAYIERPGDILAIWQGGLAFFGGLVGGTLAVVLYLRLKQADLPAFMDAVAPGVPLAQAMGRWGNYFNQELFGRPTELPWALAVEDRFAERAGYPAGTTFHPTFLYESLWNAALVVVILLLDRAKVLKRRGSLLFVYLIGYGIGRGWIEALRIDTDWRFAGLSRNNWIALLVVLLGVVGLLWWERRGPGERLEHDEPASEH
jgi:prolipoprotein diacylglyceryl transferase